jgi:small-conductance mechanosensitive channel/CRP-like cAMP-binding protein
MPDLSSLANMESLGVGLAALLVVVLVALSPAPARAHARLPVVLLVLHVGASALERSLAATPATRTFLSFLSLLLLLGSMGRSAVLLVLDVALGRRFVRPLPRIIRDITQGIVYLAVLLAALRSAGVEPGSILTTSALLTAAIALSLQETLGNMVAGLAIQVQRPFDEGDWIQFDAEPKHVGRVIEINWRATKVLTLDLVEVIVPNATLAKAPITNFTKPTRVSRRSLFVPVPASFPPHLVHATILRALEGASGVLPEPAPSVVTNAFAEGNVEYWVRFFTDQFDKRDGVDGGARDRVWYALSRAGLTVGAPARAVHLHEVSHETRAREEDERTALRTRSLGNVDFLSVLPETHKARLARESRLRMYVGGEEIVRQGETSGELFVVDDGEVVVVRDHGSERTELARLGRGQFFGEMALMTGEPRAATVRADGPCTLLVIDRAQLRAVLEASPEAAEHISRVLAERQAALADAAASMRPSPESVQERSSQLLGKIRKFFALGPS